jgi:HEAT repeat protein
MIRLLGILLLVVGAAQSAHAQYPPPQPVPAGPGAMALLGGVDVPLSLPAMSRAGLTQAVARDVLANPTRRRYLRVRAITALAHHASPEARAAIEDALGDVDREVRIQAAFTLARRFGPADAVQVADRLRAALSRADADERQRLVGELSRLEGREGSGAAP